MTNDENLASEIARQMDDLNQDRKSIEGSMQQEALNQLQNIDMDESSLPFGLCLYNGNWHQGVIGIVAKQHPCFMSG